MSSDQVCWNDSETPVRLISHKLLHSAILPAHLLQINSLERQRVLHTQTPWRRKTESKNYFILSFSSNRKIRNSFSKHVDL